MNRLIKNASLFTFLACSVALLGGCSKTLTGAEAKELYERQNPGIFFYELYNFQTETTVSMADGDSTHRLVHIDRQNGDYYIYELNEITEGGVSTTTETIWYQTSETKGRFIEKANGEQAVTSDVEVELVIAAVNSEFNVIAETALGDRSDIFDDQEGYTKTFVQQGDSSIKVTLDYTQDGAAVNQEITFTPQSLFASRTVTQTASDGSVNNYSTFYTYNARFNKKTSL